MPLGVDTPGRPPRIPPVPGKLRNEPPPAPGAGPSREVPEPGSVGTLVSTVGACATARPANTQKANRKKRPATPDESRFGLSRCFDRSKRRHGQPGF